MAAEGLERAFTGTRAIIANVNAAQMHNPTPCASWDVAALLKHMVGVPYFAAEGLSSGVAAPSDLDYAAGDFVATYDEGIKQALAVARRPGALDGTVDLPFGTIPREMWVGILTTDVFIHGWDLARATGQPADLDPELAAELLEGARMFLQPSFRGEDTVMPFGPEQQAPPGAGNADQLAAFLGREL